MGCGGSKGGGKKVDLKIEKTKIDEFDEVFDAAMEPLETIAKLHKSINSTMSAYEKACHVMCIKEHTIKDALQVMLMCCSAAIGGDWKKLDAKVTQKAPFIKIDTKKVDPSVHEMLAAFEAFVEAAAEIPEKAEPLVEQIQAMAEKCADFPGKATEAVQNANLGLMDGAKAIKACGSNVVKLGKAPSILSELIKTGTDALAAFGDCVAMVTSEAEINKINEVGKKAHAAKCFNPDKLICEFFPDQSRVDKTKLKAAKK